MANKALIPFLVGMMLLTGVCNTLLTKYQDMQCVRNCKSHDLSKRRPFEQPVWQTAQMFVGEMGCWLVIALSSLYSFVRSRYTRRGYAPLFAQSATPDVDGEEYRDGDESVGVHAREPTAAPQVKPLAPTDPSRKPMTGARVLLLAFPALCDILGTTLMNVGLLFVAASIYQMTRGALVLFVGVFSVIFLKRRLAGYKWLALVIVVAGVAIVGLAGVIQQKPTHPKLPGSSDSTHGSDLRHIGRAVIDSVGQVLEARRNGDDSRDAPREVSALVTIVGVSLIALAQVFTATQFVLEELIMHRYSVAPLVTVAWEGTFGLIVTLLGQAIAHVVYGSSKAGRGGYFDAPNGWKEMTSHTSIWVSSLLIMVSIGGFNYFGLSVTRTVSATSRSTIDTCRTLFIWVVSLGLGWESFKWLQVVGFAGLVYGTFLFNDIVSPPRWGFWRRGGQSGELLEERPIEHS